MEIIYKNIKELKAYKNNPRKNDEAAKKVANSICEFGFRNPLIIDANNEIIAGHTRMKAAKKLGITDIPCLLADDLTPEQIKAFRIADNSTAAVAEWDIDLLKVELDGIDFDMSEFGLDLDFGADEETEIQEDDFDAESETEQIEEPITQMGDVWHLGRHRLMCGDSLEPSDVQTLMDGKKAVLAHNDPPYGMGKEKDGVKNDNIYNDKLIKFNKKWIDLQFQYLEENGSWYCWGIDEPLMDIYGYVLKPLIKNNQITFRNLITWNKTNGQGQNSEEFRMFAIADEKCLFAMCGVQGFNTNSENYFQGWEPIRLYLLSQRKLCEWDIPKMKTIAGHSDKNRDHWTSKSQWSLITQDVYLKFQEWAIKNKIKAFLKPYEEIKKEYEEIKKEYYGTRAYFNNTHDNMNNVWHINRTSQQEREGTGNHATPKPLELCERVIKSSSRVNDLVVDFFAGSGSTLMACEQTKRICYTMELDPKYCDVIVNRYIKFKGNSDDVYLERNGERIAYNDIEK